MPSNQAVFAEVITVRGEGGKRLRHTEWPEPIRGRLRMTHMANTADHRTVRIVELVDPEATIAGVKLFMFDPEFIDVVGDGYLLRGHVIRTTADGTFENQQIWLVRQCESAGGPPLPRFDPSRWVKNLPAPAPEPGPSSTEKFRAQYPGDPGPR